MVALLLATPSQAREQLRIVGSSTVYPFVAIVAEEFGRGSGFRTPVIEATGTGAGFKLFCQGAGDATPDITNASRPMKDSERVLCAKNGVTDILEVRIGYDGIVLAGARQGPALAVTIPQLFLALAKQLPDAHGKLVENPYRRWREIDAGLPDVPIQIYGPPPTSGTRDSIVELVMEPGCKTLPAFAKAYPEEAKRKTACGLMREDGGFVEAGENDNIIVQKLEANHAAYGLFGFSFYEENADKTRAASIDGQQPTLADIASGTYPIARPLYVYAKGEHLASAPAIKSFLEALTSDEAAGEEGYLALRGLVPLKAGTRAEMAEAVRGWYNSHAKDAVR